MSLFIQNSQSDITRLGKEFPTLSSNFIDPELVETLVDASDLQLKAPAKTDALSLSLGTAPVQAPRADIEALVTRMEKLEKNLPAKKPDAKVIATLNALEVEGYLPPLLCMLMKKALNFIDTQIGKTIFRHLAVAAINTLVHNEKIGLKGNDVADLSELVKTPAAFLERIYFMNLKVAAYGQVEWATQTAEAHEQIPEFEHAISKSFIERRFPGLPEGALTGTHEDVKASLLLFLGEKEKAAESTLERLYYKDMRKLVASLAKDADPIVVLAQGLKAQALYLQITQETRSFTTEMLKELSDSRKEHQLKIQAEKAYHLAALFLKDRTNFTFASPTEMSRQLGVMTRSFRKLDDRFSEIAGRPLHHLCGCHLVDTAEKADVAKKKLSSEKELSKQWPTLDGAMKSLVVSPEVDRHHAETMNQRAVMTFSCRLGGAHDVVQEAFTKRYATEGMHVYNVDGLEEILVQLDFLANLSKGHPYVFKALSKVTGYDFRTMPAFVGALMKYNKWGTLKLLQKMFNQEQTQEAIEEQVDLLYRAMLERDPDLVMSSYTRSTLVLSEAARRNGVPMYNTATDFDPELVDITLRTGAPKNPHFVHALFVDTPKSRGFLNQTVELAEGSMLAFPLLQENQIVEGGFPVRASFYARPSKQQIAEIRKKWHVDPNAQVVVLLAGGFGVKNNYAEIIAKKYREAKPGELPNIHMFVICGSNTAEVERLNKEIGPKTKQTIPITVQGWTNEEQLGELYSMATDTNKQGHEGLVVSAKGGGGTVAELAAANVRLLANDRAPWVWEQFNLEVFTKEAGMGDVFSTDDQLFPRLLSMLQTPKQPKMRFDQIDSIGRSMALSADLIRKAEADAEFQKLRSKA
jgi:UDP-N-acetylglucosamine:LPS N-acetylglucosamine transferase